MFYQVCKNAFESLKEKAKRLNVHLYICGEYMKMEAVRTLLEEAVYNVCDNAIKYNRNDGSVSVFSDTNCAGDSDCGKRYRCGYSKGRPGQSV